MLDQKLIAILDHGIRLREDRSQWMVLWEELREIFYPDAETFVGSETEGSDQRQHLYTSIPEIARRGLSSAIQALMRPDGKRWFKAKPKNILLEGDEQVRLWMEIVTQITYGMISDPRANGAKALAETDAALVTFGTGVLHVGWDVNNRHLTHRSESLRNSVLMLDKHGKVCGIYVFRDLTLRQIIGLFGEEKLTNRMKEHLRGGNPDLDRKFEICHAVIPNEDYKAYGFKPGRFPYASLWYSVGCKELMDRGGYWSFPYVCPRWETMAGEIYGRSPAMTALPDARALLKMEATFLDAGEVAVRPPLGAFADLIRGDVALYSGGLTLFQHHGYENRGQPIWPIQTGELPREVLQYMELKQRRIEAAFFRDILELPQPTNEKMTAAEINARHDQYLRQAAPVFARIEANYNAPYIDRVFQIGMENGMYPMPPEQLHGQEIEFEYESPLKMARDRAEALKVMDGLSMIVNMAAGVAPMNPGIAMNMLENFDEDVITRFVSMKADLPQVLMRPLEQMLQAREARAKEQKQMQMAELAAKVGPAIGNIGQAAAKAKESGLLGNDTPFPIAPSDVDPASVLEGVDYEELVG